MPNQIIALLKRRINGFAKSSLSAQRDGMGIVRFDSRGIW